MGMASDRSVCRLVLPHERDYVTVFDSIATSLTWIEQHWTVYNERRLDYRRGNLPTNSIAEHVSGSGEPSMPERDELEVKVSDGWSKVKAHLETARIALRGVESEMAFLVNATKRPTDPPIKACSNQHCPDSRIFSMVGRDRPQDRFGRCDACRKFFERTQRERTSQNAYRLQDGVEVAG